MLEAPFLLARETRAGGIVQGHRAGGRTAGVTSTTVCPAYVRTPLVEGQIAHQARIHGIPPAAVVERVLLTEPAIKRLVEPAEVAELVAAGVVVRDLTRASSPARRARWTAAGPPADPSTDDHRLGEFGGVPAGPVRHAATRPCGR